MAIQLQVEDRPFAMEVDLDLGGTSAEEALQRLVAGNERFRRGEVRFGLRPETLADLAQSQHPYATILGCSDSRVPPELIFGAGLGELFVIRVAGNLLSPEVAGSLQYAGAHLHTPLFVVLGHQGCGAVIAALKGRDRGERQRSRIQLLINSIRPGLPEFDSQLSPKERLAQAVESNVRWAVRQILESPEGQSRVAEGRVKLVGAVYEIESGRVRFLS
jgi:carbonic anhydrase